MHFMQSILLRQDELTRLYSQGFLTDITLSTEDGKNFEAHKILLAARYNVYLFTLKYLHFEHPRGLSAIKYY